MSTKKLYEQTFNRYYQALILYANKYSRDTESSRDIIQDLFVEIIDKQSLNNIENIRSYLFQSVKNRCLNHIQKTKKESLTDNFLPEWQGSTFVDPVEKAEFEAYIYHVIDKLPLATQRIFKLSRFELKKNDEIAQLLSISKRTVELQISNALRFIRKKLREQGDSRFYKYYLLFCM